MKIADVVTEAKKDSGELDRTTARDPKTAVALRRAYSKYPTANSDIEAYIRQEIEKSGEVDQDLDRQQRTNTRQDSYLSRLQDLSRKQSQQLKSLDDENDDQEREIKDLEQQLQSLGSSKPVKQDEPKKEKPADPRAQTGPAFDPTVGQTRREKSRTQRVAAKPAPMPASPAKIDIMPSVKDREDTGSAAFGKMSAALQPPDTAMTRMAKELEPRQKELAFDRPEVIDSPFRSGRRIDTSQATDVEPRLPAQIAKDTAQKIQSYGTRLASKTQDADAMRNFLGQQELDLAEQIQRLAGLK